MFISLCKYPPDHTSQTYLVFPSTEKLSRYLKMFSNSNSHSTFRAHDSNSDDKLDGLELIDALKHSAQRHLDRAVAKHLTRAEQKARIEKVFARLSSKYS